MKRNLWRAMIAYVLKTYGFKKNKRLKLMDIQISDISFLDSSSLNTMNINNNHLLLCAVSLQDVIVAIPHFLTFVALSL